MKKRLLEFLSLSIISLSFVVISCSSNVPEIRSASASIIFEYANEDALPTSRFSVFVEAESDPRRFDSMKVESVSKDFEWETDDLDKIDGKNGKYAGYTNFVMPKGEKIPNGRYKVIYVNADEEEVEAEFYLDYNTKYYELKASQVADYMKNHNGINKIALYDENKIMLFFGERTDEYKTTRDIWYKFRDAQEFQDIWTSPNSSVICILPLALVQPEKVDEDKEQNE